jgi:hypothetical protein
MKRRHTISAFAATVATAVIGVVLSTPSTAGAQPPGFPNISSFEAVTDTARYEYTWRGGFSLSFVTPDGSISCRLDVVAECAGDIPAMPQPAGGAATSNCPYVSRADSGAPYSIRESGGSCPPFSGQALGAGKKLTTIFVTCAVSGDPLVACIDDNNEHGFVLRPSDSWAF